MRRAAEKHVDGELAGDADAQVARHLSICWECSIAAETLRLIKRALRLQRDRTPQSVAERRLHRFAENLGRQGGAPGPTGK